MKKKPSEVLVKDHLRPADVAVHQSHTVKEVINILRASHSHGKIIYFYVVDTHQRLQGTVSARDLLLADPQTKVKEVMSPVVYTLNENQNLEEAMEALSRRRLLALPVVDGDKRLKGIVDIQMYLEESIDVFKERRNQDVFQLIGVNLEEGVHKTPWKIFKRRMPWISCTMFGGIMCAVISHEFQIVLAEVIILAMFIPLVLSLSESISMQSMTQSFQLLRKQKHSWHKIFMQIFLEVRTALLMALTSGIFVGALSLFWGEGIGVSIILVAGIVSSVALSSMIGALMPLLLHLKKLDPKVASGPIVLTLSDMITTTIYLSLSTWWLL